jgi:CRISPR/Cas system CSM-associated protein Csm3 (group 7 of RAMP superfamily)
MKTLTYSVQFFTYWHTGSGLYGGTDANAAVIKDRHELPFIPGKTLKGLLLEAAETLHEYDNQLVTQHFIQQVFGRSGDQERQRTGGRAHCFFGNAELSEAVSRRLADSNELDVRPYLYAKLASTAIDGNGQAKDHTLRQIEVVVPLTLFGFIEHFPDDPSSEKQLRYCLQWIKKLGSHRSRGLGRCELKLIATS